MSDEARAESLRSEPNGSQHEWFPPKWSVINRISDTGVLSVGYYGALFIPTGAAALLQINAWLGTQFVFGPNVFIAYVASLLLAVGKLSYSIACPKIIRYYNNFNRYLSELDDLTRSVIALSTVRLPIALKEIEQQVEAKAAASSLQPEEIEIAAARVKSLQKRLAAADIQADLAEIVTNYEGRWGEAERKRPRLRAVIATCYLVSAVLAAYLLIGVGLWRMGALAFAPA